MAGETSVERLSWSSAWMPRVVGLWVEDEGGGLEWETEFIPLRVAEEAMLAVAKIGCQYEMGRGELMHLSTNGFSTAESRPIAPSTPPCRWGSTKYHTIYAVSPGRKSVI